MERLKALLGNSGRRSLAALVLIAMVGVAAWLAPSGAGSGEIGGLATAVRSVVKIQSPYPAKSDIREAKRLATAGEGSVSFAVIGPGGEIKGSEERLQYSSASVSKAMLLAAYLRSHKGRLDSGISSTLRSMITASDNAAASSIYSIVGDEGLEKVADRAGMKDFEPTPGFWGGAQITAADQARFFFRLEHNLEGPHMKFGKSLLASIIEGQRWGIAEAAGGAWEIWFKGGWRPGSMEGTSGAATHQAALLRHKTTGTRVAVVVLTTQQPGAGYETIEEIARVLLNPQPGK